MGRTQKRTVEYFPHFCRGGRTLFILEKKWGNNGYAFWFKLLELLCDCDGQFYSCGRVTDIEYLASNASVETDTAITILNMLAEMGNIDKPLWEQKKIIWCQSLVDNLAVLYSKRASGVPKKPLIDGEKPLMDSEKPSIDKPIVEQKKNKSNRKKVSAKPKKPEKKQYAEFVSMTEAEYGKLIEAHGEEKTQLLIQTLDNYKGSSGKKYASDYRAILNWVVDRVNEDLRKGAAVNGNANSFSSSAPNDFRPSGGFKENGN